MPLRTRRGLLLENQPPGPPGPPTAPGQVTGRLSLGAPQYGETEAQFLPAAASTLMTPEEFARSAGAEFRTGEAFQIPQGPPPPPAAAGAPTAINPIVAAPEVTPPGPPGPPVMAPAAAPNRFARMREIERERRQRGAAPQRVRTGFAEEPTGGTPVA